MAFYDPGLKEREKVGIGNQKTWLLLPCSFQRGNSKITEPEAIVIFLFLSISFHTDKVSFLDQIVFEPLY